MRDSSRTVRCSKILCNNRNVQNEHFCRVNFMKRLVSLVGLVLLAALAASAQTFGVDDLLSLKRLADPQLSPDGRVVAFTIGTVDRAGNRVVNQIYTINVDGTRQRQITSGT